VGSTGAGVIGAGDIGASVGCCVGSTGAVVGSTTGAGDIGAGDIGDIGARGAPKGGGVDIGCMAGAIGAKGATPGAMVGGFVSAS